MSDSTSPPSSSDAGPFRIRPARRGDAESIGRLMLEAGYAAGGDGQTVHWVVSHPEIEVFVAADRTDKVVGLISMSHRPRLRESGRIAMIEEIIVTQDWRRKGIGSALLKHAIERARVLSVRSLELLSRNEAPEVLEAFYAKAGFQPTSNRVFRLSS